MLATNGRVTKMPELSVLQKAKNICELLSEEQLADIGQKAVEGYMLDEESRAEWKNIVDKAMSIAKQLTEPKNFPWPNAANVKYPLITQACIEYASRTMPEVIQNEKVVKAVSVGNDPDNSKYRRAERVSQCMSYQLIVDSPDWEDGTDKLLQILPVLGTAFKKTYYCPLEKRIISELCTPEDIVVNYGCQSLEVARRVTHRITMYTNDIVERQRQGIYSDYVNIDELTPTDGLGMRDSDYPIDLLEQHCYLDLDEDGYKEPYIVVLHQTTRNILRIVPRFKKVEKDKNGKVLKITPDQYFTDFHFIRSPDGGFYSMGFGSLLLPLNTSINTLINQLLDAGTLSNTQGGFIGRGLRMKSAEMRLGLNEWKVLDAAGGTDIKNNIFPMPVREPSGTLFQLLELLMNVGRDLSSTTDATMGKMPIQNVAQGTLAQLVEQGTKVYTAINKRVYRSLKKEYQKIYDLNFKYLSQKDYMEILDDPEANVKKDFEPSTLNIHPVADPAVSSENQRISRAGIIQQLRTVDPHEADMLLLQSMNLDPSVIDKLIPKPDPNAPPPPEVQKTMAEIQKIQADIAKLSADATLAAETLRLQTEKQAQDSQESSSRIGESMARTWKMQQDALTNDKKLMIAASKMQQQEKIKAIDLAHQHDIDMANMLVKSKELELLAAEHQHKIAMSHAELGLKKTESDARLASTKPTPEEDS